MEAALLQAEFPLESIDLVMLAGCNPQMERKAIENAFGIASDGPICVSTSETNGETFAAGPIMDAILGINMCQSGIVPGVLSVQPAGKRMRSVGSPSARPARILINAASYEGQCASLIIETITER